MIRNVLVAYGRDGNDQMPNGDILSQHTRAAADDKFVESIGNKLFKESGSSPLYEVAVEVERIAEELLKGKGIYPNVDFYSGIVYDKMGIETEIGRAHV